MTSSRYISGYLGFTAFDLCDQLIGQLDTGIACKNCRLML